MVNVNSCQSQFLCCFEMIDIRLYTVRISSPLKIEIVCDKLLRSLVFRHNVCLPAKEFIYQCSLIFFKFCTKTTVDRTSHIREIFPRIDTVAPVIQPEFMIHGIQVILEFLTQIFYKAKLYILSGRSIIFRLIVYLKTDHTFPVCRHFHQFPDHTLRIKAVDRMCDIHDLACSVYSLSFFCRCNHIRMRFYHPGRNGICRGSDDYLDSGFFHRI